MKNNYISLIFSLSVLLFSACTPIVERSDTDLRKASDINSNLGLAYLQKGKYKASHTKLLKALDQYSDNAQAHLYMAELQKILNVNDKAEEHYKIALSLDSNNSRIKNNYGVFLCSVGKYEKSVVLFSEVLKDPFYTDKVGVYENLGLCEQRKGNIHLAEKHFRHALKLDHNLPSSLLGMSQISYDTGLYKPAKRYYLRYLALARHSPQSLWLGILIERKYKNYPVVESYSKILRVKYPDSKEAILLDKLEGQDGIN